MLFFRKLLLYFHTIRYLKWTQIRHRVTMKLCHPKPDFSPAPPLVDRSIHTSFPHMPASCADGGRFRFLNEEHSFTIWNDSERNKLWLYNLHYFDWLRQDGMTQEEGTRWIRKWIAENPAPVGNGWEPYPISLRIVNWLKWHASGHLLSEEARQSLAVQARFLMKRLEYHLLANHLLANAKALVFAGCFFHGPESERWLAKGLEIYREQLPEQILADGGHFELSPMYHSIILEDLLDLKNIRAPMELDGYLPKMLHWLAVMTGPDGKIALFNDAAHGIALNPDVLQAYGQNLGFVPQHVSGSEDLPSSGYSRLQNGHFVCICDTGGIGPSCQPGHAHADALSFELWKDGKKILSNCGTGRYYDSPERKYQRSSAAHNTSVIDGENSSEVWSAHRVARRGKLLKRAFSGNQCGGTFRTWKGFSCTRDWQIERDGMAITDTVRGRGKHRISFVFHPLTEDVNITPDSPLRKKTEPSVYSPEFGIFEQGESMVFETEAELPKTVTFKVM